MSATGFWCKVVLRRTREVDGAVVVSVNLVDHILKFRLGGVLAEGSHDSAQLLGSDLTCSGRISLLYYPSKWSIE